MESLIHCLKTWDTFISGIFIFLVKHVAMLLCTTKSMSTLDLQALTELENQKDQIVYFCMVRYGNV